MGVQWAALAREVAATLVSLATLCHGKVKIPILYLNIYKLIPKRAPVCHPPKKKIGRDLVVLLPSGTGF